MVSDVDGMWMKNTYVDEVDECISNIAVVCEI